MEIEFDVKIINGNKDAFKAINIFIWIHLKRIGLSPVELLRR
jgi:hypothetical protein